MYGRKGFGGKKIVDNFDYSVIERTVEIIKFSKTLDIELSLSGRGYFIKPRYNFDLIDDLATSKEYKLWSQLVTKLKHAFSLVNHTRVSVYKSTQEYVDKNINGKYCTSCQYALIWLNTIKEEDILTLLKLDINALLFNKV